MHSKTLFLVSLSLLLAACGTLTGIPAHGGGKRFAIEQELVAASARAAAKNMDLRPLQGRKVALYVSTMGDQGSGTISGGRYSIDALIRGEYANTPASRTEYAYPSYTTTANTAADALSSTTQSTSLLNVPRLNMGGMGEYRNETLITNPQDTSFLSNIIRTVFFLRGIEIVPEQQADTVMFINIDVFGTIRSRTEMHLYNAETLKAQTKLEYFAADRSTRRLLIKPSTEAYEAKYQEKYALWMGPYKTDKNLKPTEGLMADFSDITPYAESSTGSPSSSESPAAEIPNGSRPSNETIRQRRGAQP